MKIIRVLTTVMLIGCFTSSTYSETIKRIATVITLDGDVKVKELLKGSWQKAKVGNVLGEGSYVKTGEGAKAFFSIDGDLRSAIVEVSEKSIVSITTLVRDSDTGMKKTILDLTIGQVLIKANKLDTPDSKFEVKTPTSAVGVRGTKFSVKVKAGR